MEQTPTPLRHDSEDTMPIEDRSGAGAQNHTEQTRPPQPHQASQIPTQFGGPGAFVRGHRRSRIVLGSRKDLANVDFQQIFMPLGTMLPSAGNTAPKEKKERKSVRFGDLEEEVFTEWLLDFEDL
ncbi:uncharacterized protein DFL_003746 [Arthrobotrys flagrans]|uniref:Uncharacterized protein n=1 Tax=Arthrobotrys flagrans TaxID=97331 RepID=A0A437A2Q7_ARTFL|nr:hypothetical protein DFL_003746 [Arthrobotrys flagrans]